jgi:hypothetical protein
MDDNSLVCKSHSHISKMHSLEYVEYSLTNLQSRQGVKQFRFEKIRLRVLNAHPEVVGTHPEVVGAYPEVIVSHLHVTVTYLQVADATHSLIDSYLQL